MANEDANKVADIVRDAGGKIIGRTRLQKIAYLLTLSGLEEGFVFEYKHYGPYSEDMAAAARDAGLMGLLTETEKQASWGGMYSTYCVNKPPRLDAPPARLLLAKEAAAADSIVLELAATAAFLAKEGHQDPWAETERRKPEKAGDGRLGGAKALYRELSKIPTPKPLPAL